MDGDLQGGSFLAGQIAGLVNREQTAQEIVDDLMGETEKILSEASKWVK